MAMRIWPCGQERTEQEYGRPFEDAGFRLHGVTPTASSVSMIEGRPV